MAPDALFLPSGGCRAPATGRNGSLGDVGSSRSRRREKTRRRRPLRKVTGDRADFYAPFGDVSFYGPPMPSEMPDGWRWYAKRLRMIDLRGAAPYVARASAALLVVIVIGALLLGRGS